VSGAPNSAPDAESDAEEITEREPYRRNPPVLVIGTIVISIAAIGFGVYLATIGGASKDVAATVQTVIQSAAIAAALLWFVVTAAFAPRIQFDVDVGFTRIETNEIVAELRFIFENKGFVEHRIYRLKASVHRLGDRLEMKPGTAIERLALGERLFPREESGDSSLIPKDFQYYFVRPGVRQMITHVVLLPADAKFVTVRSSFWYDRRGLTPHSTHRVFSVTDS
jgi:hypothetical protein